MIRKDLVLDIDHRIMAWPNSNSLSRRLDDLLGELTRCWRQHFSRMSPTQWRSNHDEPLSQGRK